VHDPTEMRDERETFQQRSPLEGESVTPALELDLGLAKRDRERGQS
jgi:hypothetical protein